MGNINIARTAGVLLHSAAVTAAVSDAEKDPEADQ